MKDTKEMIVPLTSKVKASGLLTVSVSKTDILEQKVSNLQTQVADQRHKINDLQNNYLTRHQIQMAALIYG